MTLARIFTMIALAFLVSNLLLQQHAEATAAVNPLDDIELDFTPFYKLAVDAYEKLITEYEEEHPNTSTLSNREIAIMIVNNRNFSDWQEAYIKIVEKNPKGPLESIWSLLTN